MALGDEITGTAGLPPVDKFHLLIIGVEYYAKLSRLPNAVTDAARVADVLTERYSFHRPDEFNDLRSEDQRYHGPDYKHLLPDFQSIQTTCLYNENATKKNFKKKLNEISGLTDSSKKLGENDALLIYFAGHGIRRNFNYFLLLHDSEIDDPNSWLNLSEIGDCFDDYPLQKHSRHVLVILDSCFADAAASGAAMTAKGLGTFSRQVLTSCSSEEPADDGIIYGGSAFANSFIGALKDNQTGSIFIEDIVAPQKLRFAEDATKSSDEQTISLSTMTKSINGSSSFPLFLRETEKPDIDHLRESIIDYLDFDYQRGKLKDEYQEDYNHLNIIKSQGSNIRVHQMLSKVVFKWFNSIQGINFDPGFCFVPAPINLDMHGDEDIFAIINKSVKLPGIDYEPAMILQWFTDQMKTTDTSSSGNRHLILRIEFSGSPAKRVQQVGNFCIDFINLYKVWSDKLTDTEKTKYGKIFVLISDASANGLDPDDPFFQNISGKPGYNFIPFEKNSNIKVNHIRTWLTEFHKKNKTERIQQLIDRNVFKTWVGNDEYEHDKFIEKFCSYCEFTQQEIDKLNAQLYDYNKTFLI